MKQLTMACVAVGLWLAAASSARAQAELEVSPGLARARAAVNKSLAEQKPGWASERVTPIEGSRGVVIDKCTSGALLVSVCIIERESPEAAVRAMNSFEEQMRLEERVAHARGRANFNKVKERLDDFGDGGFAWDDLGSTAATFRKGLFTVYINVAQPQPNRDQRLSKEFARVVADALSSL